MRVAWVVEAALQEVEDSRWDCCKALAAGLKK